jgi:hypothetical protein
MTILADQPQNERRSVSRSSGRPNRGGGLLRRRFRSAQMTTASLPSPNSRTEHRPSLSASLTRPTSESAMTILADQPQNERRSVSPARGGLLRRRFRSAQMTTASLPSPNSRTEHRLPPLALVLVDDRVAFAFGVADEADFGIGDDDLGRPAPKSRRRASSPALSFRSDDHGLSPEPEFSDRAPASSRRGRLARAGGRQSCLRFRRR